MEVRAKPGAAASTFFAPPPESLQDVWDDWRKDLERPPEEGQEWLVQRDFSPDVPSGENTLLRCLSGEVLWQTPPPSNTQAGADQKAVHCCIWRGGVRSHGFVPREYLRASEGYKFNIRVDLQGKGLGVGIGPDTRWPSAICVKALQTDGALDCWNKGVLAVMPRAAVRTGDLIVAINEEGGTHEELRALLRNLPASTRVSFERPVPVQVPASDGMKT